MAVSVSFSVLSQPTKEVEGGKGILIERSVGCVRYCEEGVTLR